MEKLRTIRIEKGLTRRQVATMTGTRAQIVGNYETGKTQPHPKWLKRFCQVFNVGLHFNRNDIRIASKADLEYLYQSQSLSQIADLYQCSRWSVKKRFNELSLPIDPKRRVSLAKFWQVHEVGETFIIKDLKAYCKAYMLNYKHVYNQIHDKGEYKNGELTITRRASCPNPEQPDRTAGADENWADAD
jgi:transcriptional regulator with XRE-family HTH domain